MLGLQVQVLVSFSADSHAKGNNIIIVLKMNNIVILDMPFNIDDQNHLHQPFVMLSCLWVQKAAESSAGLRLAGQQSIAH